MAGLFDDIIPSGAAGEKQGRVTSGLFSDLTPDSGRPTDGSDDLLTEAQKQFPALKGKNIAFVKTLDAKSNGNMLEAWPPDEPGTPDYPRPKELPLDQYGIQVFNKDTKPSDVAADVVSHFLVKTDPALKAEYDKFAATFSTPDRQARLKEDYEWSKKNEGETRPFNEWATTTRIPDYFRGYVFNQWPDKAKQGMFNDDQRAILDGIASSLKAGQGDGDKESADSSSLFGDLVPERTLGGQVTEAAKGIIPGAVKFGGTTLKGAAGLQKAAQYNAADFGRKQLEVMDRIDRGESVPEIDDAVGYQQMSPEQRKAARADMEQAQKAFAPGKVEDSVLFQAGESVRKTGEKILPAAPGYEDSLGRSIGEGLGSVVAGVATSAIAGPVAGGALFTLSGSGESVERAVQNGASEEDIIKAAQSGQIPGMTDSLPIETLLGRIPLPGGKFIKISSGLLADALKVGGRIGFQALIEGIQEGGQEFLQNAIEQTYNPNQTLMENVPESAALGATIGGIAGGAMAPFHGGEEQTSEAAASGAKPGLFADLHAPAPAEAPKITATPEATVDRERVNSPRLTPEDRASPIPNDLIDDGKAIIEEATTGKKPELQTSVPTPETSIIAPSQRAILRKAGNSDDEIDAMSSEERQADIGQALQSGIEPSLQDVASAQQYKSAGAPASVEPAPAVTQPVSAIAAPAPSVAIDAAAHEAATSPANDLPEPTQAQKEAGNYKVGRARIGGLDISIENPQGSERKGTDKSGKPWSVTMESHYGYIRGTVGKDKDHIDTFIRPGTTDLADNAPVFVIDQKDPSGGNFDEHKVMMGFDSQHEAEQAYRANYTAGWKGMGAITPTTMGEFKTWLKEGNTKQPFAKSAEQESNIAFRREVAEGFRDNGEIGPRPEVQAFMDSLTPEQRTAAFRDFQQADNVAAARELLDDDTIKEMGLDKPQLGESAVAKEIYRLADAWQAKQKTTEPAPQQALKQKLAAKRTKERAPQDLIQFLAGKGGLRDFKGELKALDLSKHFVPGYGKLLRANGLSLDRAREAAEEAGYISAPNDRQTTDISDLLNAIEANVRGKRVYAQEDHGAVQKREEEKQALSSEEQARRDDLDEVIKTYGPMMKPAEIDAMMELIGEGMWPEEAAVEVLERTALAHEAELDDNARADEGLTDAPFDTDREDRARRATADESQRPASEGSRRDTADRVESGDREQDRGRAETQEGVASSAVATAADAEYAIRNLKKSDAAVFEQSRHIYYSPLRPIGFGFPIKGEPIEDKFVSQKTDKSRVIATSKAIPIAQLNSLELVPITATARLDALKEAIAAWPGSRPDRYEFASVDKTRRAETGAGAIVTKSAKDNGWQLTSFDANGFAGDMQFQTLDEALKNAITLGSYEPAPGHLADMIQLDTFVDPEAKRAEIEAQRIADEAASIAEGQKKLKDRAMIYQADAKEKLALERGLPKDTYYNLSYDDWAAVQQSAEKTSEKTDAGEQSLIPGVRPVTTKEKIEAQARKPMQGGNQPAGGLFDDLARNQLDLVDLAKTAPAAKPSVGNWLEGLDESTRAAATKMVNEVAREYGRLYEGNAPGQGIAVGSMGERTAQKAEALASVVRAIRKGESPEQAAATAKAAMRQIIAKHNERRDDPNWKVSEGSYDRLIDDTVNRINRATEPTPEPAPQQALKEKIETKRQEAATAKISDFGEKIEGARKDQVSEFSDSLSSEVDIVTEPLSKIFPQPDYAKLAEAGVDRRALALIAVAREQIPAKPRKNWKVSRWAEQVRVLRGFAHGLMDGTFNPETVKAQMLRSAFLSKLADTAEVINALDPELLPQAAKWRVESGAYTLYKGQRYDPPKRFYTLRDDKGRFVNEISAETLDDLLEPARKAIRTALGKQDGEPSVRRTKLSLYQDRISKTVFIGFKGQSGVIRLKTGFATVKDARSYMEEHADDLQAKIDEMRKGPQMRREVNRPREGVDRREGDVSPEHFQETFGFRGVQFGNYVEDGRRQFELNEAFDGLMDLADILAVPPQALSLNGSLGLAFGARGRGGAAKAHYEPVQVVINLTKGKGAGSLAHEWFHGLDNYFAKQDAGKPAGLGFMSERRRSEGLTRQEVFDAWKKVEKSLAGGEYSRRMGEIDAARSKSYWNTMIEKAARAFEKYVVDRLTAQNASNDYLANIDENAGAYPRDKEMRDQGITEAMDGLFKVIETRASEGGVEMFSAAPEGWGALDGGPVAKEPLDEDALQEIRDIVKEVSGLSDVAFADRIDLPNGAPGWGNDAPTTAAGKYEFSKDAITIALDSGTRRTAFHEAFHRLQHLFLTNKERAVLKAEASRLRGIVGETLGRESQAAKMSQSELEAEAFAIYAEGNAPTLPPLSVRAAWKRIATVVRRVRNLLAGRGYQTVEDVFDRARTGKTRQRTASAKSSKAPAFSLAERRNLVDTQDIPRVKAVTTPLSKRIMSAIKRGKPDPETLGDYSHRKLVDYLHPIRTMIESVGGTVQDTMNAYLQARLAEDAAIARIQGVHDAYVTPAVEALAKVGASLDDLHRYLYARHAPERNRVVGLRNEVGSDLHEAVTNHNIKGASGWSTNEAKQVIRELSANAEKFAGIQEAARLMRAMIDSSLLDQKKAGLISDETYKLLTEQWQHYVPLRAEDGMDENGNYKPGQGRGFDIRGKEFKAATGRSTEAENIPAWAVSLSERTQLRAEKNNVGKAMLRFINHFDPKGESLAKVYWSNDEGFGDIEKAPPVYQREIGKDGKVTNRTVPPSTIAPDMFAVKVGGKAYYIKFADEKVGLALKKMGVVDLDALSRLARKWTSFQSLVNTRANPAFIPVNIIRDAATGGIHLLDEGFSAGESAKILTSIPNAWGALWRNARGKPGKNEWDAALKEYIAAGGKISFEPHKTLEDSINELRTKMTEAVNGKRRWKAIWDAFVNFLGDLNDSGENGMRLAAYVAARAQGRTVKQAAFLGRDLTVDFKKHGEVGPLLNSWFVFFNASVQGNYNIAVRLLKSKKVRRAAYMIAASGVLADLLNRALSGDDDDGESYYEKMLRNEPWKFERSMVIFYGGDKGDYFTIPLPYGYNAIYHMGVQAAAAAHGDVKPLDAIAATARVTFDAFNPIGGGGSWLNMFVPTILDPAVEIATNQSFTGAPITPTKFPGDTSPDSQRFFQSTPDWARTVADWMNTATGGNEIEPGLIDVSPDVYEHLWGYVSGGIGRFFGQALDTGSKVATGRSDEIEPQNVPWVRSFMGRVNDDTRRSEYYKQREEVQTVKDRLHDYKESGEPEEVKKYIERHRTAVESIKAFDSAEKGLKKIRKAKRSIDLDRDLSRSEKDEKLKPLKDAELKIMNGVRLVYARNRHRNEP